MNNFTALMSYDCLFPASAGMNRMLTPSLTVIETVPRVRGDEPMANSTRKCKKCCSPRPRG